VKTPSPESSPRDFPELAERARQGLAEQGLFSDEHFDDEGLVLDEFG